MKITITDDTIDNWDSYSTKEKKDIATTLSIISRNILYSRIRLIEKESDLKESDNDTIKDAAKYIGEEIISPACGTVIGIEETLEDYYYMVQTDTNIEYVTLCSLLILKKHE